MTTLATVAANLSGPKPKKDHLQQLVKELYDRHPDEEFTLAQLYNHFMPPEPKKPKTDWGWVALAMGDMNARDYLNFIHVAPDFITGTDGHRMHRVPNWEGLEPGFYFANGDKAHDADWRNYPNIERLILKKTKAATVEIAHVELAEWMPNKFAYVLQPEPKVKIAISKPYLDAAIAGAEVIAFEYIDGRSQIRYQQGDREAIVMPMRI